VTSSAVATSLLGSNAVRDDLVLRARSGERVALETLIDRHMPAAYRLTALRLGPGDPAVEDVVQEALISVVTSVSRLRGDTEAAFVAWLLSITRHRIADHLREVRARRTDTVDQIPEPPGGAVVVPDEVVAGRERGEALRAALAQLTADQEEILVLRFVLGYGNEEVAAITGRTVGAVKSMQHRGLASMARMLTSEDGTWTTTR
jgi:RNA polymerase sigma-70 factor (ECF subfamily)